MKIRQSGTLLLCSTTHLITEDDVRFYPAEEEQIESHVDHPQVGTERMQVAKYTGRQPVTHTHLFKK